MNKLTWYVSIVFVVVMALSMMTGLLGREARAAPVNGPQEGGETRVPALASSQQVEPAAAQRNLVLSYAAKFVCTEALQPGQFWYGPAAPIVQQKTDILVHNPNAFSVTLYKKAVIAPIENFQSVEQGVAPGEWKAVKLAPDYAFRIDCDDIAKLLTGNANATFATAFPPLGTTVEGFVIIGIGQQQVTGSTLTRFAQVDVVADYVRSSEVLKKDIQYQPWWRWWWWTLPWRLGYPYQRILPIDAVRNIDCRGALIQALANDAREDLANRPQERDLTLAALETGAEVLPNQPETVTTQAAPALVPLIGRCDKINANTMSVDYVLVSNKGPTDNDPRGVGPAQASQVIYPWIPGRWYDLALVTPQNLDVDIDDYFRTWQSRRWEADGETAANVQSALVYFFPYWCGWGYWWWWWHGNDCIDIGVGEGESLDVERITPVRVFMPQWPPVTQ